MKIKALLAGLAAAALLGGALADPVDTEYLVDMTSDQVLQLEQRLAQLGYLTNGFDGVYDADTRMAIESFQQANGLEVTGTADSATMDRINADDALSRQDYLRRFSSAYAQMTPMEKGSISNDVQQLQRRLKEYGYFSGAADGVFGDATQMAVETFQMVNGLPVTGVADGATLMRLMADAPITWPAFLSEMSAAAGDSGLNVYALQNRLKQMGYFNGACTGSYGDLTQQAVTLFQRENGLEETGSADPATWVAIYSGAAVTHRRDDALQLGDSGDSVRQVQDRLKALGYHRPEPDGNFGYATQTAVRLFQMACGLAATGEVDSETLTRLMDMEAPAMQSENVRLGFEMMLAAADETTQTALAETATGMLGTAFGNADDDLYPGFSFVQYVCVAAGLPVSQPEDLIRLASQQVESASAVDSGDIVAFQSVSGDSVSILLAIGAGDGKVICVTDNGGWVVVSFMDQLESANIYRWDARGSFGE